MKPSINTQVCIIGAGSGGLSVAAGAAQLGLSTVLIEKDKMGGDCLNTGCVPSKALLAAAKHAQLMRSDRIMGIKPVEPDIDFLSVKNYVNNVIRTIEPNDSQERFEGMGVKVLRDHAQFITPDLIQSGPELIKAKYIVIATGSRPVVPPINRIETVPILTNETIFSLNEKPEHLLIVGAGPIGIEMAQAHKRLGCDVSVFDMGTLLPRDDKQNVAILKQALISEGINLYEGISIEEIKSDNGRVIIHIAQNDRKIEIAGTHLLMAAGRAPNTETLGLDKASINYNKTGIIVDKRLRTNNKHIFAIGDVAGGPQFTHVAGYHAGIVIKNICFKIPAKVDYRALPWVTYTDPELAQVGLTEQQARERYGDKLKISQWEFNENDRAITEANTQGRVSVITTTQGHILGASIVGPHAGEISQVWGLAISSKLRISAIAGMIAPYPTLAELNKRVAGAWYTPKLFSDRTRKLVNLLQRLPF